MVEVLYHYCEVAIQALMSALATSGGQTYVPYRRLGLSGALRYVAHIRYQAHARFLAKNLVKRRTFRLNVIQGGATAHKIERRRLAAS